MPSGKGYRSPLCSGHRDSHRDCLRHHGPFQVVDADSRRKVGQWHHSLSRAFAAGDRFAAKTGGDYLVLDEMGYPVTKSMAWAS